MRYFGERLMTIKEFNNQSKYYDSVKVQCKCGTKTVFPYWVDKKVCRGCGHYVYRNKRIEFKERLENARKNYK